MVVVDTLNKTRQTRLLGDVRDLEVQGAQPGPDVEQISRSQAILGVSEMVVVHSLCSCHTMVSSPCSIVV